MSPLFLPSSLYWHLFLLIFPPSSGIPSLFSLFCPLPALFFLLSTPLFPSFSPCSAYSCLFACSCLFMLIHFLCSLLYSPPLFPHLSSLSSPLSSLFPPCSIFSFPSFFPSSPFFPLFPSSSLHLPPSSLSFFPSSLFPKLQQD